MLLAIEQGNTNTLFAVHDGETWTAQWRAATDSTRTADEYAVWLFQLLAMAGLQFSALDACIISSVVPQSIFNLRNLARRYLHVEPLVIGENADLGIEVRIDKPSEAGADRILSAQLDREARLSRADDVVVNAGSRDELKRRVRELHAMYLQCAGDLSR